MESSDKTLRDEAMAQAEKLFSQLVSVDQLKAIQHILATPADENAYLVVQEGGASTEMYLHGHDTEESANDDRIDCTADGSYRTGPVIAIPKWLAFLPGFIDCSEELIKSTNEVDYVDVPDDWVGASEIRVRLALETADSCEGVEIYDKDGSRRDMRWDIDSDAETITATLEMTRGKEIIDSIELTGDEWRDIESQQDVESMILKAIDDESLDSFKPGQAQRQQMAV